MPISRREFELNRRDPAQVILQILEDSQDSAFSLDEILEELARLEIGIEQRELTQILQDLARDGRIDTREIKRQTYYIYRRKSLGFRPRG